MTPARATLVLVSVFGLLWGGAAPLSAAGRDDEPAAILSRGAGPAVVLLSGLLGGAARLEPLADRLVASGFRVVLVDPYRLAVDASDVSFHGLARTVEQALQREAVRSAVVVAHAHAAGIAVRLAASSPEMVSDLLLLDAGVLATTRSVGVARAMRVASLIARLPGGPSFIRARLAAGIRANSGDPSWVNDAVARAYTEPLVAELPAVARMAARLSEAQEPEPVDRLLGRVRADLTVLLGGAPHGIGAGEEELALLRHLPGARVRRLNGVGHFVHEEAPEAVVAEVLAARARRAIAVR